MKIFNDREAYVALNLMTGIGPIGAQSLIDTLGTPRMIWEADRSDLLKAPGIGPILADKLLFQRGRVNPEKEIQCANRIGVSVITRADPDYPDWLAQIHDPPLVLYVMGELRREDRHALAIVGTRHASFYGRETTARLADQLARAGWTVISGLARGIDTVAHTAAVNAGGRTIAVLGGGLAHIYPAENIDLARRIADGHGAVVSEFPLDRVPDRTTFPMRNRIVSGLSRGVLVIEAGRKSGTLITANQALEQGRSVLAVPGRVDSPGSRGTHALIKAGACLVEDMDDILAEFEFLFPGHKRSAGMKNPADSGSTELPANLPAEERQILELLQCGEQDVDTLIRQSGIPAARMNVLLLAMEMKQLARMLPGRLVAAVR